MLLIRWLKVKDKVVAWLLLRCCHVVVGGC